jgi:HEAT repeat protein
MMTLFPHETIRNDEDRSFTFALLERLVEPALPEDEREEIACTLKQLDDPRVGPRLLRILEDRALPAPVRETAGTILLSCGAEDRRHPPAMLRDGDPILQRHAVLGMDHSHADIVEAIARDPGHPLYEEAIQTMTWGFEEPRFEALKIAALSHPTPSVRATAADVLFWDEPVAAEEPLLRVLDDPDDSVASEAANTLQYYPTRRVLARLAEVSAREGTPGEQAQCSLDELRFRFQGVVQRAEGRERDELIAWMQPVWPILAFTDDEIAREVHEPHEPVRSAHDVVTMDEMLELLSDLGGQWAGKKRRLQRADPAAFSNAEIDRLAPFLATHPDPEVRCDGARLLAAWNRYEALFGLIDDPRFLVVKSAMYRLGQTDRNPRVAARAEKHLFEPFVTSTHARETLDTYVAHAPAKQAISRLSGLARQDERESIRSNAVYALTKLGAIHEIEQLLPQLEQPPLMTWAVPIALLEACRKLDIPPRSVDALLDVDNLDVRRVIARMDRTSTRHT